MSSSCTNRCFVSGVAILLAISSFFVLIGGLSVNATDSVVDQINIRVPISCTVSGTGMNSHNAEIVNGGYQANIGTTTLHAFCNDSAGFAIYAAGYTGDEIGGTNSNKLVGTARSGNSTIVTGLATTAGSPDVSNWAMKLSITQDSGDITGTNALAIDSDTEGTFANYHTVPNEYVKVAHKNAGTDMTAVTGGVKLTTTYAAYISRNQAADTYTGQVKYTLVHPSLHPIPQEGSMLITGQELAAKMKTLAAGTSKTYNAKTSDIKAIRMTDTIPAGYDPDNIPEANVVSVEGSKYPVYIFFDNTNDAGIIYFYSEGNHTVIMNPDSAHAFRSNFALTDISGLRYWDTSKVTTMMAMFLDDISLTNVNALADWDTYNVESLYGTFSTNASTTRDGYRSSLSDISALANWDTSRVTNMQGVFQTASSLSDISALSCWDVSQVTNLYGALSGGAYQNVDALANWDVSKVETMRMLFAVGNSGHDAGIQSQLTDISALANWKNKLSNVTSMQAMFQNADKITDLSPLSEWNVSGVTDFNSMFMHAYGIVNLDALSDWNVSGAANMQEMFRDTINLVDASAIKNWDVTGVTATAGSTTEANNKFYKMFAESGVSSSDLQAQGLFTTRAGTWNSAGTYVVSE